MPDQVSARYIPTPTPTLSAWSGAGLDLAWLNEMIRYLAAVLAVLGCAAGTPAAAQRTQGIAAIVDDDIVSMFDLQSRMQMVIVTSGLKDTPKVREKLAPQVLRGLIDEQIRLQEAKRRNISVTKSNLKRAVRNIEVRNKLKPGKFRDFLESKRIPEDSMFAQLRSQIAWNKLVNRRLRPRVVVSEEEIDEALNRIKSRQGQIAYHIAEIFLSLDSPEHEAELRRGGKRLVEQLRAGALFSAVARQFSQSTSATSGGDLGWFHESELDVEIKPLVLRMGRGEISDPVLSLAGFRIIQLIEKRRIAAAQPGDTRLTLKQLFLPLAPKAGKEETGAQLGFARTLSQTVSGCDDLAQAAKEINSPVSSDLGTFKLRDLSPRIGAVVKDLEVSKASVPVRTRTGIMILMVCRRDQPKNKLPTRKAIENQILARRVGLLARRYMRDLRRAAVVDLRR